MEHDLRPEDNSEYVKYVLTAIEKFRLRKLEASDKFEEIFKTINSSYENAIKTLDDYITKLEKLIKILKNEDPKHYFENFPRVQNPEFFIIVPPFEHKLKEKYFDVFKLEEPQGFLRVKDIEITCNHPISSYFNSSCGKTHCFMCEKTGLKNMVKFDDFINIPPPINENDITKSELIKNKCPCKIAYTKREMIIFKYLALNEVLPKSK